MLYIFFIISSSPIETGFFNDTGSATNAGNSYSMPSDEANSSMREVSFPTSDPSTSKSTSAIISFSSIHPHIHPATSSIVKHWRKFGMTSIALLMPATTKILIKSTRLRNGSLP
eukprot:310801_1